MKARKASGARGKVQAVESGLQKAPSGIRGLDEVTCGGLPRGRPTLVCGGAGCGKTLFAMEFLVRGAVEYSEPGVFMSFEETSEELAKNVASLGFGVGKLIDEKMLAVDFVRVERAEIEETGEFDLGGLFVRLQLAIDSVGAKRVVLDTVESLFSSLPNPTVVRSELRRLFRWLKDRHLTVVLTGEKGEGSLTRHGLEEYVSDCVIFLDHRITEQVSTRRLRVVKYRGSTHGTNEYPFLIDSGGIAVLPITSLGLLHEASMERLSSGIPRLDQMLGGAGFYRGSTVLVSGTAGTGKTSIASHVVLAACQRGERCVYFAYEESASQICRNMHSIGLKLEPHLRSGALQVVAVRPESHGLEHHLVAAHRLVTECKPAIVVADPITDFLRAGNPAEASSMLTRLIDFLKERGTTGIFTSLTSGGSSVEQTEIGISSLIDTWLLLEVVRTGGERNRTLSIIKSRGTAHSNQTAEYRITSHGVDIADTYVGSSGVLTGSARLAREAEDAAQELAISDVIERKQNARERLRKSVDRQIAELKENLAADESAIEQEIQEAERTRERAQATRTAMAGSRHAFAPRGNHAAPANRSRKTSTS